MEQTTSTDYPQVTFFVESREESETDDTNPTNPHPRGEFLTRNIGSDPVLRALREMKARVAVALNQDEIINDSALIHLLQELNSSEIAIDIWPNLRDEDDYWIHAGNIELARRTILEMINQLEKKNVGFCNVGLDLEMPIGVMRHGLFATKPWKKRRQNGNSLMNMVVEIMSEKQDRPTHGVNTYEIPILGDLPWLRNRLCIPEPLILPEGLAGFKRVAMVYTSCTPRVVMPSPRKFIIKQSAGKGRVPALGIVTGTNKNPGRNFGGKPPKMLPDKELERDVAAALQASPQEFFVFALNGEDVITRVRASIQKAIAGNAAA